MGTIVTVATSYNCWENKVGKCNKVKENVCWMLSHTLIMAVIIPH